MRVPVDWLRDDVDVPAGVRGAEPVAISTTFNFPSDPKPISGYHDGFQAASYTAAIYDATGVRLTSTPFSPESILKGLRKQERERRSKI